MSTRSSRLFSYEILGLVGRGGAGAHDLLRMAQRGRILAWAGESQYYAEPKRLARLGYLDARKEPGKTRERTVYTLTEKGLEALRDYARTPVAVTPLKSDALLRLLICDLVGEEVTRESMATLRDDIADLPRAPRRLRARAKGSRTGEVPAARDRLPAPPARPARTAGRRGRARVRDTSESVKSREQRIPPHPEALIAELIRWMEENEYGGASEMYVAARRALLDALDALADHLDALVLVGAQAIYIHTGDADVAIATSTKHGDLVVNPDVLRDDPLLEQAMEQAWIQAQPRA